MDITQNLVEKKFYKNSMNKIIHIEETQNSLQFPRLKVLLKNCRKTIIYFEALYPKKGDFMENEWYLAHEISKSRAWDASVVYLLELLF